jgi:hypothetical protein
VYPVSKEMSTVSRLNTSETLRSTSTFPFLGVMDCFMSLLASRKRYRVQCLLYLRSKRTCWFPLAWL